MLGALVPNANRHVNAICGTISFLLNIIVSCLQTLEKRKIAKRPNAFAIGGSAIEVGNEKRN